ncbi:MAG: flagellar export chaperone FliS [Comamonas sp.]
MNTSAPHSSRPASRGARAYAKVGLETRVASASPQRLITLLFEGAIAAIAKARYHLANGNIAERGQAISKAINIVQNGLMASLNHEAGGEISANLHDLYDYAVRQLLQANLRADDAALQRTSDLLAQLADAWRTSVDPLPASPASA